MDIGVINLILNIAGIVGGAVGAISVFFTARKKGIAEIQNSTITAMQQQIEAQKGRIETLETKQGELEKENYGLRTTIETILKENYSLRTKIETILAALLKRGIHVTIDNEMVVISGITHDTPARKRPAKSKTTTVTVQEKEQTDNA